MDLKSGMMLINEANEAFNCTERRNAEADWQDILKLILIHQNIEVSSQGIESHKGSSHTKDLKDSTAARANHELSSTLFSTMTPPTAKWCKLRHKNMDLNNNNNVSRYLDDVVNMLHNEFSESNFYTQVGKAFPFFTAMGTMIILHEEKVPNPDGSYAGVRFTALHPGQAAWSENDEGIVDRLYRRFEMTPAQIMERFKDVPENVIKAQEHTPNDMFVIWHCIRPRKALRPSTGVKTGKDKPYGSYYIMEADGHLLDEDGFSEFPAYVVRMDTAPGEVIGRGLGHLALPDVRQLQELLKRRNRSMALATEPPTFTQQNSILSNSIDLRPGHNTIVQRLDGIKFFESTARFDVTQMGLEELRKSIQATFMIDKLLLPPRTDTGEMSAFEVAQRIEQTQRVLGPTPNRIITEFLKPLIARQFSIMFRRGAIPERPPELENDALDVEIIYVNQLARAQNIEEVTAMQQWVQFTAMLAQLNPAVIDTIDTDEAARHAARVLGVPEKAIAGDTDIAAVRQQRAQMQQMQMEADIGLKQADAQSKLQ